jgi:hypothetical protein
MANERTWLRRVFRRSPERDGGPDVRRVLEAYGACLERRDADRPYRSERELPYAKEEIEARPRRRQLLLILDEENSR